MRWDLGEETKFRRLLRRKVDEDILRFELAALRTLTPEDFFTTRPYLLPEWVVRLKELNLGTYKKLLRIFHGKYKSVMMKRNVKSLSDIETKWLMEKLTIVCEKASIITRREVTWLKQQREQQTQTGNQPGSRLEESVSQPMAIDSLSAKTSSGLAMSAGAVEEEAKLLAQIVAEQVATAENEGMK